MNLRLTHKAEIKRILETIVFELVNLTVSSHYITNADRYPYIFITSGGLIPNTSNGSQYDTGSYYRGFDYDINCIFDAPETDGVGEARIDELEGLILQELSKITTRENINWNDLVIQDISAPYRTDPVLKDNTVIKTFNVRVKTLQALI